MQLREHLTLILLSYLLIDYSVSIYFALNKNAMTEQQKNAYKIYFHEYDKTFIVGLILMFVWVWLPKVANGGWWQKALLG